MTSLHTSLTSPEEIKRWLKAYQLPCEVSQSIKVIPGKAYIFDRLNGVESANGHWNFIYTTPDNEVLVYDPFGVPFYVDAFKNKTVCYSLEQDQKLNEKSCGLYCFLFAFKYFNNILHLKQYMIIDYPKKTYYATENYNNEKYKKYIAIYSELHKED